MTLFIIFMSNDNLSSEPKILNYLPMFPTQLNTLSTGTLVAQTQIFSC